MLGLHLYSAGNVPLQERTLTVIYIHPSEKLGRHQPRYNNEMFQLRLLQKYMPAVWNDMCLCLITWLIMNSGTSSSSHMQSFCAVGSSPEGNTIYSNDLIWGVLPCSLSTFLLLICSPQVLQQLEASLFDWMFTAASEALLAFSS